MRANGEHASLALLFSWVVCVTIIALFFVVRTEFQKDIIESLVAQLKMQQDIHTELRAVKIQTASVHSLLFRRTRHTSRLFKTSLRNTEKMGTGIGH